MDSQSLKSIDYCATFSTTPPSPLALEPCGEKDGYSQTFAYNATTGQLSPVYHSDAATLANSTSFKSSAKGTTDDKSEEDQLIQGLSIPPLVESLLDTSALSADADDDSEDTSDPSSFLATAPKELKDSTSTKEAATPTADLYFVPASSYYDDAKNLDEDDDDEEDDMDSSATMSAPASKSTASAVRSSGSATPSVFRSAASGSRIASSMSMSASAKPTAAAAMLADAQLSSSAPAKATQESDIDLDDDSDDIDDDDSEDLDADEEEGSDALTPTASASPVAPKVNLATPCPMEMSSAAL